MLATFPLVERYLMCLLTEHAGYNASMASSAEAAAAWPARTAKTVKTLEKNFMMFSPHRLNMEDGSYSDS